ncbi:ankyrin repeat protein [Acanthamoeba polyphaga mimivirus]|uniref:Ankyrin repeat protein n=1 Tax=Acanthamoeba polyphaga mimivirus TaxID=212035 RepID=A0A2L2DK80_MIMIV|nr:ankyrin repeat protein [Acanthamoeba polyphaga mimivirus]
MNIGKYDKNEEYYYTTDNKCKNLSELMHLIIREDDTLESHQKIVDYLELGIYDINATNEDGWTALMIAAVNSHELGNINTVKLLLDHGADINIKNKYYETVIYLVLTHAPLTNNYNLIKLLLDNGADTNIKNIDGKFCLVAACRSCNNDYKLSIVELLLKHGADVNMTNCNGESTIMQIYKNKCAYALQITELLIRYGVNINLKNRMGMATLDYAFYLKKKIRMDVVILLLLNGANYLWHHYNINDTIFSRMDDNDYKKCQKVIEYIGFKKIAMRTIHKFIPLASQKIIWNPDSLRSKLFCLKWNIDHGSMDNIITWNNLELFDYLDINDLSDINFKINDILKYL